MTDIVRTLYRQCNTNAALIQESAQMNNFS